MQPIVVSDILAVGEFPSLELIEILAKAGFKSIINNQPDGEVERFPGSKAVEIEAKRCGLAHAYAPIASRTPESEELAGFVEALRTLPAPIFAFCYSGERSAAACAFARAAEQDPKQVIAELAAAGFDFSRFEPWLADEHKRHAAVRSDKNGGANESAESNGNGHAASVPKADPGKDVPAAVAPLAAKQAVQGIVVHARARGYSSYAM